MVETNANFIISTEDLRNKEDVKCDDDGSWINNGVRKIYMHITDPGNPKKLKVTVFQRGGKAPGACWILTRTYFVFKNSKDFKKVVVSLQGQYTIPC